VNGAEERLNMSGAEPYSNPAFATDPNSSGDGSSGNDSAQQQDDSSGGHGFWSHVRNLLHGHSWNYGMQGPLPMRESVTVTIRFATDAAGLVANATKNTPLGYVSAGASVANDHSAQNVITNGLGLVPGFGWPMAITGAFIDLFDYGIHNSTPGPKKDYDNQQLQLGIPSQDGGCLAAGSDFPC